MSTGLLCCAVLTSASPKQSVLVSYLNFTLGHPALIKVELMQWSPLKYLHKCLMPKVTMGRASLPQLWL